MTQDNLKTIDNLKSEKIYVAGHRGLVGSAFVRCLASSGFENLVFRTSSELDLRNQQQVADFFDAEKPTIVVLAAAKVGGIKANNIYRAEFLYDNVMIQQNVIHQSYQSGVKKLLFLGSSCIYPKFAKQPMSEDQLLTGAFEYTNEPYAIAKVAGIKMCESYNIQYGTEFLSVMPTNLYGENDNFDLDNSHVLPALIRKIHLARLLSEGNTDAVVENVGLTDSKLEDFLSRHHISADAVSLWGTGTAKREFLLSDEMVEASMHVLQHVNFSDLGTSLGDGGSSQAGEIRNTQINIGCGYDISIKDLAHLVKTTVGYQGEIRFDLNDFDGTPRKLMDCSKLESLGWKSKVSLETGIKQVYDWYLTRSERPF